MLLKNEIESIFEKNKHRLLSFCAPVENPTAFILGGQGASGKSLLAQRIGRMYDSPFLFINGDDYRIFHPQHEHLISNNTDDYSSLTQPFSNIFTENLINEAIKNKFNVIIEGTMRNQNVPYKTANLLKEYGFIVNAAVIAAHPKLTELNCYSRFFNEVSLNAFGRLADINSHNMAADNMPKSIDFLYQKKVVDSIHFFKPFPIEKLDVYNCKNGVWDKGVKPSIIIENERQKQIYDKGLISERLKFWDKQKNKVDGMVIYKKMGDSIASEILLGDMSNKDTQI